MKGTIKEHKKIDRYTKDRQIHNMPLLSYNKDILRHTKKIYEDLKNSVSDFETTQSQSTACVIIAQCERCGLFSIFPQDEISDLCEAAQRGLFQTQVPNFGSGIFEKCLYSSIRSVLGVTVLSEYGSLSGEYVKIVDPQVSSGTCMLHQAVQLRVVMTVCRIFLQKKILREEQASLLAGFLFDQVQDKKCQIFEFELPVFDDILATEELLAILADNIVNLKIMDLENAILLTTLWLNINSHLETHFQTWDCVQVQNTMDNNHRYMEKLDVGTKDATRTVYTCLLTCVGPERNMEMIPLKTIGRERVLMSIFFPGRGAFKKKRQPAVRGPETDFLIPPHPHRGPLIPRNIADQFLVSWNILFSDRILATRKLQQAVICEFITRIVAVVNHKNKTSINK